MRTFIFGAGASVHAGYPLAAELWRAMEPWARAKFPEAPDVQDAIDAMNSKFDVSKSFELVLADLDNEFKQLLKATPTMPEVRNEKVRLEFLRETMEHLIPLYFNSLRSRPADLYRIFAADVVAPGDAVITFNYDLAVDRELKRSGKWSIGNGYGFEIDGISFGNSPCKLLKLHGSTNWHGELFQTSRADLPLGEHPIIDRSEYEHLGYRNVSDAQCHTDRARIESLIMPTANKRFYYETNRGRQWEGFWDSLWYQAGEALEKSEEVHMIGYSIPEYDTRARELLATKIDERAQIKVCCHYGTADVIESLRRLMHLRNIHVEPADATTFEGWVSSMKQD